MDPRDSSSSASAAIINRDDSFVDDEGVFSLANDAAVYFQLRDYAECLKLLNQLLLKKPGDPKVLHNIAVAEYFRDGCSDLRKLLSKLNDIKKLIKDAHMVEDLSEAGNYVKKTSSVSKESTEDTDMYTGQSDTAVASLNIALIWYHLHDYARALSVLAPVFQNIEPVDESIALKICLLFLDAGLALQNATKSADVLSYLEKAFYAYSSQSSIPSDSPHAVHQHSSNIAVKSVSVPPSPDMCIADATDSTNVVETTLSRALSEETINYITLLSTLDSSRGDINRTGGILDRPTSTPKIDLRLLQLYKVRFLLLTRNLKTIKREVKEAMNLMRGGDSTVALLLKSQCEYARGNYPKAIKLLMASNYCNETVLSSLCNNNFGCIFYQIGKFHTSANFFSKALTDCSALRKNNQKADLSQDESLAILYNCGLQYLASGKPIIAAHCFQKASMVFSKQPLLWLRIAECCLLALEKGLLNPNGPSSGNSDVMIRVIGRGKWRHLVIEDNATVSDQKSLLDNGKIVEDKPIKLSVSLARQSLLNALTLLNASSRATEFSFQSQMNLENCKPNGEQAVGDAKLSNGDGKELKGGQGHSDTLKSSIAEFEQIRARENQLIRQTLLGHLAYVELELGNPLNALSAAKSLLELPDCAKIYVFLGRSYAAEALCLLGRPQEAAEQLLEYMNEETGFVMPYKQEDCEPWGTKRDAESMEPNSHTQSDIHKFTFSSPAEARGILFVNMATLCARQGDMEQAYKFATQSLSVIPNNRKAILTLVYVNLVLGKTHEALAILKQSNRVKFLTGR